MLPKFIGIIGKAGSGKSTVADMLKYEITTEEPYSVKLIAFADPLKYMIYKAGMATEEELFVKKTPASRWMMQKIGTDIFRNQVDPNFWIKEFDKYVAVNSDVDCLIVHDVRFPNEAKYITDRGGILLKVVRFGIPEDTHASEVLQDDIKADYTIVNDYDLKTLREAVSSFVDHVLFG